MVFVVFRRFHQNRCIRCQTSPDLSSNGFFSPRNRHIRRQKSPDSSSNGVFHSQPSKSPHSSSKIARFVVKWSFSISNRHIRRQKSPESSSNSVFHSQPSKSPHSSSKIAGVVVKWRLSFPTLEIATFVVKTRRIRRQTASFIPNPRNHHIRRQKSPGSSSNFSISNSPHSSSKIAGVVVKQRLSFPTLEIYSDFKVKKLSIFSMLWDSGVGGCYFKVVNITVL